MCPDCEKNFSFKKSLFVLGLAIIGILGLEAQASGGHDHSKMDHSKMDMKKSARKSLSEASKKSILSVLAINEKLHQSFFTYNAATVESNANALKEAISSIEDKEIAKLLKFSSSKLSEIKASNDRDKNNKLYNLVSMALIHVINKYDIGNEYNAYSCPMVKMKWIQNSKKLAKVHNPYAPEMPHCGAQDSHY